MKIKLATIYASPNVTAQPGTIIDVSDEEGQQLVDGHFGVEVPDTAAPADETPAAIETADTAAPETATVRTSSRGRRNRAAAPADETPAK